MYLYRDEEELAEKVSIGYLNIELEIVLRLGHAIAQGDERRDVLLHGTKDAGRHRLIRIIATKHSGHERRLYPQFFLTLHHTGGNLQAIQPVALVIGSIQHQILQKDTSVHIIDGATGKVGVEVQGNVRIDILIRKVQLVRTEVLDRCLQVEVGHGLGYIEVSIHPDLTILIVQGQLSVEATILIKSVEGNVFVAIIAIIEGMDDTFDGRFGIFGLVHVVESAQLDFEIGQTELLFITQ